MSVPQSLFTAFIDDASMFPPGNAPAPDAVAAHADYRRAWFAPFVGPLVVQLADIAAISARQRELGDAAVSVSLINATPAGALLPARLPPGVEVVAVETVLAETDNPVAAARALVAAAADIDPKIKIFVEFTPFPGWPRAVGTIAAAGLRGKIRTGSPDPTATPTGVELAHRLTVLIEAGLPFKATAGLHHAWARAGAPGDRSGPHGFLNLLLAVDALLTGGSQKDAAALLDTVGGSPHLLDRLRTLDATQVDRIRGRFCSFGCCGVRDPIDDLVALDLIGPAR